MNKQELSNIILSSSKLGFNDCDRIADAIDRYIDDKLNEQKEKENLPSAEKTAEWIVKTNSNGTYGVCSNCRKEQCAGLLNYCPYCGARMKGESEEEE